MTFYIFHNKARPDFEPFCFFDAAFSGEECDQIIAKGESLQIIQSKVSGEGNTNEAVRKSKNSWIDFAPEVSWLYDKLGGIVMGANDARYGFQLTGFMEHLQYTLYDEHGSHYRLHSDFGRDQMAQRKLSMVLFLSNPEDYDGGELEFFEGPQLKLPRGSVVVFPSFQVHGVRPVTRGIRKSLVCWVSGEPFR